jgi:succinate dehydrogenase / fumarate reductase membrane anchor subunit
VSLRSPLGRVLGLGAAKDGVSHWWTQRLSAVALVPLTLWFLLSLLRLEVGNAEAMRGWLAAPVNTVAALLLVLVWCVHSRLGLQVVVEDYVHRPGTKLVSLVLIDFAHVVAAAIGVLGILKIAFGVAT